MPIDCLDDGRDALQLAIDACVSPCYFELQSFRDCDPIAVTDKRVHIDGAVSSAGIAGDPAVLVARTVGGGDVGVTLVGLEVLGGIRATGLPGDPVTVRVTGTSVQGSSGDGITGTNALVTIEGSIWNNTGDGIHLTDSTLTFLRGSVRLSDGNGIFGVDSDIAIPRGPTINVDIADSGLAGIAVTGGTLTLESVRISSSGTHGISADGAAVTVTDWVVDVSGVNGINVTNGSLLVDGLRVEGAVRHGIVVVGAQVDINSVEILDSGGWGLWLDTSDFSVTNTIIALNGDDPATTTGGMYLQASGLTTFAHNTVAANEGVGIECVMDMPIVNSLVWDNTAAEVSGCGTTFDGSHIELEPLAQQCGSGAAPTFRSVWDYRLAEGSACIDAAPDCAGLTVDVDGLGRPRGPSCDVGADEF